MSAKSPVLFFLLFCCYAAQGLRKVLTQSIQQHHSSAHPNLVQLLAQQNGQNKQGRRRWTGLKIVKLACISNISTCSNRPLPNQHVVSKKVTVTQSGPMSRDGREKHPCGLGIPSKTVEAWPSWCGHVMLASVVSVTDWVYAIERISAAPQKLLVGTLFFTQTVYVEALLPPGWRWSFLLYAAQNF